MRGMGDAPPRSRAKRSSSAGTASTRRLPRIITRQVGRVGDRSFPTTGVLETIAMSSATAKAFVRGLTVALVVWMSLARAEPASGAEKAIWGPVRMPDGSSAFPTYRALGVDVFQIFLDFSKAAPTRPARQGDPADPAYRWPAELDEAVREGRRHGIAVAILVWRSPGWANGGRSPIWVPDPRAFSEFVAAASRRYGSVRRWMIWGEPNKDHSFQPNRRDSPEGPRAYASLLDAAYRGLKRVSRRNVVIGGMTWTGGYVKPAHFLRFLRLPNGRRPRLDWFGHNPFPFRWLDLRGLTQPGGYRDFSDLDVFIPEVRRAFTRRCGRRVCGGRTRLWLSEFTIQSDHGSHSFSEYVSRPDQAKWLARAYRIADRLPSVAGLGWATLLDQPPGPLSANWGLMTFDARPKPSYAAFQRAPSRRLRPRVAVRGRLARSDLATRGLSVRVRPRISGHALAEIRTSRGRLMHRTRARVRAGRAATLRLRPGGLRRGNYSLEVSAPRGERVFRSFSVR